MPTASWTSPIALRRFARRLVVANLVVLAILVMTVSLALMSSREAYKERALSSAENLARVLALNIASEIKQVDNALASTILEANWEADRGGLAEPQASRIAQSQRSLVPQVDTIRLTDADGIVINSDGAGARISLADRDYFKATQAGAAQAPSKLIISEPLQGRIIQKWGVILSRARVDSEGGFQGIAYSSLSSDHFVDMFDDVLVGHHGAVTLRTESLRLIARFAPSARPLAGGDMGGAKVSADLQAALRADPEHGAYITITAIDGIERATAYQRVPGYPLLVLVGLGTEESYWPWRHEALSLTSLAALLQLLIAASCFLIYRQQRRQVFTLAQLAALTAEQGALLDNELVSMARFSNRNIVWHNKALAKLFGYGSQELVGRPSRQFYVSDEDFEAVGRSYVHLAAGQHFRTQIRMQRKDGSIIWIDLSGAQVSAEESLWMMVDVSAVKESETQARHVAMHDGLTGLGNRAQLPEALRQALVKAQASGRGVAVCYIDLDGFKAVNDTHGHGAGDALLREAAKRMKQCVRSEDSVVRMGGDEFVIVLNGLNGAPEIEPVLSRLLGSLQRSFNVQEGVEVNISASIGVATWPENGNDADTLMERADQAMYAAKRAGKNRLVFS